MIATETTMTAAPQTSSSPKLGTCSACFREMRVVDGLVVRHGWQETGGRKVGRYGQTTHVGGCFGVGRRPFEETFEAASFYLVEVAKAHRSAERRVEDLRVNPPKSFQVKGFRETATVRPGDRRYDSALVRATRRAEAAVKALRDEAAEVGRRIWEWTPGELRDAEVVKRERSEAKRVQVAKEAEERRTRKAAQAEAREARETARKRVEALRETPVAQVAETEGVETIASARYDDGGVAEVRRLVIDGKRSVHWVSFLPNGGVLSDRAKSIKAAVADLKPRRFHPDIEPRRVVEAKGWDPETGLVVK